MKSQDIKKMFTLGIPFGVAIGVSLGVLRTPFHGVIGGTAGGFLFGFALVHFINQQAKKFTITTPDYEGHPIVHQGPANHFRGLEGRGGWLVLTTKALHFKSHGKNFNNDPVTIPLKEIERMRKSNTLGFVPNGLLIFLQSGKKQRFVLQDRATWIKHLGPLILPQ